MDIPERPKDRFFAKLDAIALSVTFDDLRIKPGWQTVPRSEINLESRFSTNVPLHIPLVSAAMDTVTEMDMAIVMARMGGLGVIHRNLTPEEQARQVGRVKHYMQARIDKPITVYDDQTVQELLRMKEEKGYKFDTFPVISRENGKLVGIITKTDIYFAKEQGQDTRLRNIMSTDLLTAPVGTDHTKAYHLLQRNKKKVLPLITEEGTLGGMYTHKDLARITRSDTTIKPNTDSEGRLRVGAAIGVGDDAFKRLELLAPKGLDVAVIDLALGGNDWTRNGVREIKRVYPDLDLVAGNVSEPVHVKGLADQGVNGLKHGFGPSSICTSRIVSGTGSPQITTLYENSRELEKMGLDIPLCADGGIKYSGDITIALAAGAHSVMMGTALAATSACPGEIFMLGGKRYMIFRGMGSLAALEKNEGSKQRYGEGTGEIVPEGVVGRLEYKGETNKVLAQHIGGLRKGLGYAGMANIEDLRQNASFHRMSSAGLAESHVHNITVVEDAPNYSVK